MSSSYQHVSSVDGVGIKRDDFVVRWMAKAATTVAVVVVVVVLLLWNMSTNTGAGAGLNIDWGPSHKLEVAYLNLMRHGEKDPDSGDGLSRDGIERAEYYKRCMNPNGDMPPSELLPKPVGNIMAQKKAHGGRSKRSALTFRPLADSMGVELHETCKTTHASCLLKNIQSLLQPDKTLLIAWEHKFLPNLLKQVLRPSIKSGVAHGRLDRFKKGGVFKKGQAFHSWPEVCDAQTWQDPLFINPTHVNKTNPYRSSCYDAVWQIKFVRTNKTHTKKDKQTKGDWEAVDVRTLQAGFGGEADSPCAEGLAPI